MKRDLLHGSTMSFGRVGRTYVCVHWTLAPSDADWKAFIADIESQAALIAGLFVYSLDGAGPNAMQRKQVAEMWARVGRPPAIAVVTKSPAVQAMITALNYFLARPIQRFSPEAVDTALDFVRVPDPERAVIRALISTSASMKTVARMN